MKNSKNSNPKSLENLKELVSRPNFQSANYYTVGSRLKNLKNAHEGTMENFIEALIHKNWREAGQILGTLFRTSEGAYLVSALNDCISGPIHSMGMVGLIIGGDVFVEFLGGAVAGGVVFKYDEDEGDLDISNPLLYVEGGVEFGAGAGAAFKVGVYASSAYPDSYYEDAEGFVGLELDIDLGEGIGAMSILTTHGHIGLQVYDEIGAEFEVSASVGLEATFPL